MNMESSVDRNKELITTLTDLIKINHDRVEGYRKAIEQANGNVDLQAIFKEKANESADFSKDLQITIASLGGKYEEDTTLSGKVFRAWMDIKDAFKPNDRNSILDSCEFGEDAAIKAYDDALRSDAEMSAEIRQRIIEQQTAIKKSHDLIKKYRDLNLNLTK